MLINISDVWASARASHNLYLEGLIDDGLASLGPSALDQRIKLFLEFLKIHLTAKNIYGLNSAISYHQKLQRKISRHERIKVNDFLVELFDYKAFSRRKLRDWSAYKLCRSSNYRVCPYCHYSLMLVTEEKKGGIRPDLDHWYPQHLYPYLALALNNLVPSCLICNSRLKGSADMHINSHLHPFLDSESLHFRCEKPGSSIVDIITDFENVKDQLSVRIDFNGACQKSTNTLTLFQLRERYALLSPDGAKFVGRKTYSDGLEDWFQAHLMGPLHQTPPVPQLKDRAKEIRQLGFDRQDYKNEVFGKMYADLYDQYDRTSLLNNPYP